MYKSRITLDIDGDPPAFETRALRAYYTLRHMADEVEVSISSSGYGLHIVGWFDEVLSDEDQTTIRRMLCDDPMRIDLDHVRGGMGHTTDVLWTNKGGSGTADEDVDDIHQALDRIRAYTQSDYDAMRILQNEGTGRAYSL